MFVRVRKGMFRKGRKENNSNGARMVCTNICREATHADQMRHHTSFIIFRQCHRSGEFASSFEAVSNMNHAPQKSLGLNKNIFSALDVFSVECVRKI